MLAMSIKQTRAYQEAERAGREKEREELLKLTVPLLLEKGMTTQEIAKHYKVSIDLIQRFVPKN